MRQVEHPERKSDRRQGGPEQRDELAGEEKPELSLRERPEPHQEAASSTGSTARGRMSAHDPSASQNDTRERWSCGTSCCIAVSHRTPKVSGPIAATRRRNSRARSGPSLCGRMLLPVALEAGVRLPEGHRLLVRVAVVAEVGGSVGFELLLRGAVADAAAPFAQAAAQLLEVRGDVLGDAEVNQCEPLRAACRDLVKC